MMTRVRRPTIPLGAGIAMVWVCAAGAAGCSLSARQIDLAEAYTASVNLSKIKTAKLADKAPKELVGKALATREAYLDMLKEILDREHERDGEDCLKRRPKGYRNVMAALEAYKKELQKQEEFGDATLVISVITDFKHKLVVSQSRYRPVLETSLRLGTRLLRHIDALTNSAFVGDEERALNARLTDLHFATQEALFESRSCMGDNRDECRDLYEEICQLGKDADPESKGPHLCADRPCWAE